MSEEKLSIIKNEIRNGVIDGLIPLTSYNIFCYTEDFNGQTMPFNVLHAAKQSTKTLHYGWVAGIGPVFGF